MIWIWGDDDGLNLHRVNKVDVSFKLIENINWAGGGPSSVPGADLAIWKGGRGHRTKLVSEEGVWRG